MKKLTFFRFISLLLAVGLAGQQAVQAEIPDGLLSGLKLKIEAQLRLTLDTIIDKKAFAEDLFLKWPVTEPKRSPQTLRSDINSLVKKDVKQKFPANLLTNYVKGLRQKYRPYQPGDMITITMRNGTRYKGRVRNITRKKFKLDNQEIRIEDLDDETRLYFDSIAANEYITRLTRIYQEKLRRDKKKYERQRAEFREEEVFKKAGYLRILGKWVAKSTYFNQKLSSYRKKLADRLRPMLKVKIYHEAGLARYHGVWMTKEDAEKQRSIDRKTREAATKVTKPKPATPAPDETTNPDQTDGDEDGLW